jgi:hypothetical protein
MEERNTKTSQTDHQPAVFLRGSGPGAHHSDVLMRNSDFACGMIATTLRIDSA